jgi:hypothetical protein
MERGLEKEKSVRKEGLFKPGGFHELGQRNGS